MNKYKRRKSYFKILTIAIFLLSIITMGFSTVLGKDVVININGEVKEVFTYANDVETLLNQEKIELKDDEEVYPSLSEEINEGMEINIRKIKTYKIKINNRTIVVKAKGASVQEVLNNLGIKVNKLDIVKPSLDTATDTIEDEFQITIYRVKEEVTKNQTEIDFQIISKENKDLEQGEKNIITPGQKGLQEDTIKSLYINDNLRSQELVSRKVIKEPVTQVEEIGVKNTVSKSPTGDNVIAVYTMKATAYDPSAGSRTASGTRARVGAVAVDPSVIALGSKLYIESTDSWPSYGYAVAEDTGGAIKGNRIDLFFNSNATANKFGRRTVKVYVLGK